MTRLVKLKKRIVEKMSRRSTIKLLGHNTDLGLACSPAETQRNLGAGRAIPFRGVEEAQARSQTAPHNTFQLTFVFLRP